MNKKTAIQVLIVVIVILFGFFSFFLHGKSQKTNITQQYTFPSSFMESAAYSNNTIVYSDTKELVEYSYDTGSVQNLTSDVGLNAIDTISVSPNNNYIVFHDQEVSQSGSLAVMLSALGLNPSGTYWWLYNTQTHSLKPISQQGVLLAKVDNNNLYTLSVNANSESEYITTYNANGLQQRSTISVSGSSDFYPVSGGFLLQSPENEIIFTSNGTVSQELFKSSTIIGVSSDGHSVLMTTSVNGSHVLNLGNLSNNAVTTVTTNLSGAPVWSQSGIALYGSTDGNLYTYSLATNKSTEWNLGSNTSINPTTIKLNLLLGPTTAVVSDQHSNIYIIGTGIANTNTL